jgi:3-oxoacyl-[acyl-carrier protein] reductase
VTSPLTFGRRTAVITGGSRNIGLAIAEKFLLAGLDVAIIGRSNDNLLSAAKKLVGGTAKLSTWQLDLNCVDALAPFMDRIESYHESIDILVNCAGVLELNDVGDVSEVVWDETLDGNLKTCFFVAQAALPYLRRGASPRIINISSNAGRMGGYANGPAYAASKGGIIALTYSLARRLAKDGITVNCVAPGTIVSDMSRSMDDGFQASVSDRFPIGRLGLSDEVAAAVCYFASVESGFTTGAVLDVNGGLFMG